MINDLKIIKKKYGEKMMHLCRELFPTILETPGLLSKLMLDNFEPTRFLYNDIIVSNKISDFKNYIYSLVDQDIEKTTITTKTPQELFEQIGYYLYECKTEQDIQSFKKYYKKDEELCTFNGGRLKRCYVFFAVRKDVENIKREDFQNPRREDDYGVSVMSIQFSKGGVNTLSIKNRYNHTVPNCDSTFSNNLENIVPGLTESFERKYNLTINQNTNKGFGLPGYIKANDRKYYKFNYEFNNICYCPNNIIIDNFTVKKYDREKYVVLDYFILDLQNKKMFLYDKYIKDCFANIIGDIDSIKLENIKETGNKKIYIKNKNENEIIIEIDSANRIIGYKDDKTEKIGDNFLIYNTILTKFEVPLLRKIGDCFMNNNRALTNFEAPLLTKIGNNFLPKNSILREFNAPLLQCVKDCFLEYNCKLTNFYAPKLLQIGNYFLVNNKILSDFYCPYLVEIGDLFLYNNEELRKFSAPSLLKVGECFLNNNNNLNDLNVPLLEQIGDRFLFSNHCLTIFEAPKLKYIGCDFLYNNQVLSTLVIPSLISVTSCFLFSNKGLKEIDAPNLRYVKDCFMAFNKDLFKFNAPNLKKVGEYFFSKNNGLRNFNSFSIKRRGLHFLSELNMSDLDPKISEELQKIMDLDIKEGESIYNNKIRVIHKSSIFFTILINKVINGLKIKKNEIGGNHIK